MEIDSKVEMNDSATNAAENFTATASSSKEEVLMWLPCM